MCRFGIAYKSLGVVARPLFGVFSLVPMSCEIKTVSTSLYPM